MMSPPAGTASCCTTFCGASGISRALSSAMRLPSGTSSSRAFARDGRDAAFRALSAGLNMDMASSTYLQHLAGLVEDGTLKLADIDDGCAAHSRDQDSHGALRAAVYR